jgi:hypothetical protein
MSLTACKEFNLKKQNKKNEIRAFVTLKPCRQERLDQ